MRIGVIAPPFLPVPPVAYGGTEAVIDLLVRGLRTAGHDVVLACAGDSTAPVPKVSLFERSLPDAMGDGCVELAHVLHARDAMADVDVIHDHTLLGPATVAVDRSPPVATTAHNPFAGPRGRVYREAAARTAMIAISHHQAATATGPIAAVIHHGVDIGRYPFGDGSDGGALFLGRVCRDKGVHLAIGAARRSGLRLTIAGTVRTPDEQRCFDDVVRPSLGRGVEFVGEVGHAEKVQLLSRAGLLLNPIQWPEPFGLAMVEALACGTPVVATRHGAAPEIVDDGRTGFLRATEEELASAARAALDLDRRRCRAAVADRFSGPLMVQRHVELYEQLVAGEHPSARTGRRRGAA